jgi:hypothetical protein
MPSRLSPDEAWAKSAYAVHAPAAQAAASITVTPAAGEYAHVDWVVFGTSDSPNAADLLTMKIDGVVKFTWRPGVATSVQGIQVIGPFVGEVGEVLLFEFSAPAGAGDTVVLSIKYRKRATIT